MLAEFTPMGWKIRIPENRHSEIGIPIALNLFFQLASR